MENIKGNFIIVLLATFIILLGCIIGISAGVLCQFVIIILLVMFFDTDFPLRVSSISIIALVLGIIIGDFILYLQDPTTWYLPYFLRE